MTLSEMLCEDLLYWTYLIIAVTSCPFFDGFCVSSTHKAGDLTDNLEIERLSWYNLSPTKNQIVMMKSGNQHIRVFFQLTIEFNTHWYNILYSSVSSDYYLECYYLYNQLASKI